MQCIPHQAFQVSMSHISCKAVKEGRPCSSRRIEQTCRVNAIIHGSVNAYHPAAVSSKDVGNISLGLQTMVQQDIPSYANQGILKAELSVLKKGIE